ncbi:AAA family ATPase [Hymenobacter rubidus]|uniref:AAA family ATPase n=1 Tax=Hymenobacter rubidus TaxID=1441626 RepID=UPI00191CB585|nr:AAA family ATPase [Hymenobacter rubidus]
MKNAITTLRIQNFKSIKDVEMKPRRVNIIIGEPNVGKSNILEAMSLLGGMVYDKKKRFMSGFLRYERVNQLFFDNLVANTVQIESNRDIAFITPIARKGYFQSVYINQEAFHFLWGTAMGLTGKTDNEWEETRIDFMAGFAEYIVRNPEEFNGLEYVRREFNTSGNRDTDAPNEQGHWKPIEMITASDQIRKVHIRPYFFVKGHPVIEEYGTQYLQPPVGDNLKNCIQAFSVLRQDVAKLFAKYGLKLMLHMENKQLEVIKDLDGIIYSYPYSSTADTLQRLIFYLAAIESNDDAVILLEEPEAHSFPVYVSQLGRRIVASRNNQFFVATHSPYLITEILEEMLTNDELAPELAMFVAYYEDYQTKVRQLDDDEVRAIRADGLDVFYNMARFVPGPDTDF